MYHRFGHSLLDESLAMDTIIWPPPSFVVLCTLQWSHNHAMRKEKNKVRTIFPMKFFKFSLLSACVVVSSVGIANATCSADEKQVDFTFFLDEDSYLENGWSLTCDNEGTVWNVPAGMLQWSDPNALGFTNPKAEIPYVKEHVCLPRYSTCHFTLQDSGGDGLLFPGYYYLALDDVIVGVSSEWEEFEEKSFCFGPNCPSEQNDVQVDCDFLHFFFQTDDSPEESSIEIECGGQAVVTRSEFRAPYEAVQVEECIPFNRCCTLTVKDTAGNGLDTLKGGHAFLEWANQIIFQYDSSNAFDFDTYSVEFGRSCSATKVNA